MKGRSSKQGSKGEKGVTKSDLHQNLSEEPHLSGAYIRGLVKQLTSSRIKDPMNPEQNIMEGNGFTYQNLEKFGEVSNERLAQPQHKKQVRRRLHTTRPYQERLLNMAEARKEIVTALKLHRASMKKQGNEPNSEPAAQEETTKSRRNPRTCPPNESVTYPSNQSDISSSNMCHSTYYPSCSSNPYSYWPSSGIANFPDNLNFALPSQTLGLNLNIQEFNNLDKTFYQDTNNSSCSYSSPKSNLVSSDGEISNVVPKSELGSEGESSGLGFHQVIDEDEMAEMKSMAQQHEVEWNDTVNLVTSSWWLKFMDNSEKGKGEAYSPLDDEMAKFPDWLNADGSSCLDQDYVIDNYSDECLQDSALPCLDIGEIEGMDGEWLA